MLVPRWRLLLVAGLLLELLASLLCVHRAGASSVLVGTVGALVVVAGLALLIRVAAPDVGLGLVLLDAAAVWLVASGALVSAPWSPGGRSLLAPEPADVGVVLVASDLLVLLVLVACWLTARHGIRGLGSASVALLAVTAADVLVLQRLAAEPWVSTTALVVLACLATGAALVAAALLAPVPVAASYAASADPVRGLLLPGSAAAAGAAGLLVQGLVDADWAGAPLIALGVLAFVPRALLTRLQDRGVASGALADVEEERLRFEALVEASTDFVALADADGGLVYLNPAGRRMVGLPLDEDVAGRPLAGLVGDRPQPGFEDFGPAQDRLRRLVTDAEQWPGEQVLHRVDGGPGTPVITSTFALVHHVTGEEWLVGTIHRDIGEAVEARRQLVETVRQRQQLLGEVVRAQEEERARIAADVHDDSVQSLTAVDLRLQLLGRRLPPDDPEVQDLLREAQEAVRDATDRLRHLLFDLDVPVLETDLVTALRDAASFVLGGSVAWDVEGPEDADLPEVVRVVAYRIAQQALHNIAEHAAASRVEVTVREQEHEVVVEVRDDGRGYDPASAVDRPGHLGLRSMRQRALAVGGRVEVDSAPGRGTIVRLTLPRSPAV